LAALRGGVECDAQFVEASRSSTKHIQKSSCIAAGNAGIVSANLSQIQLQNHTMPIIMKKLTEIGLRTRT